MNECRWKSGLADMVMVSKCKCKYSSACVNRRVGRFVFRASCFCMYECKCDMRPTVVATIDTAAAIQSNKSSDSANSGDWC